MIIVIIIIVVLFSMATADIGCDVTFDDGWGGGEFGGQGGEFGGAGGVDEVGGAGGQIFPTCEVPNTVTRSSPIALAPDAGVAAMVVPGSNSVIVASVNADEAPRSASRVAPEELSGAAIDGCGVVAYTASRQGSFIGRYRVVDGDIGFDEVDSFDGTPSAIALSSNNEVLAVADSRRGTVSFVDTRTMASLATIDLNEALVSTGALGAVSPRAGLAHPRNLAWTGDGRVVLTEQFALRKGPDTLDTLDTNHVGLVYVVDREGSTVSTVELPAVPFTGFSDDSGAPTGCYPTQVDAIEVHGKLAYVTSTCVSPSGPRGAANAATLTHPALSIVDLENLSGTTILLDALFAGMGSSRMPNLPVDLVVVGDTVFLAAEGADAVFRLGLGPDGSVVSAGSPEAPFIDLQRAADTRIHTPVGLAPFKGGVAVLSEGTRELAILDVDTNSVKSDIFGPRVTAVLPPAEDSAARGKQFFSTGLGPWSADGAAWTSCATCHRDGSSDGVTWYFDRGPRQTPSLDGVYVDSDPAARRIFNWTATMDETSDLEAHLREVAGGAVIADPDAELGLVGTSSGLALEWLDIDSYLEAIPSPRGLDIDADTLAAGREVFSDPARGNCVACHSGPNWTLSTVFYKVSDSANGPTDCTDPSCLGALSWNIGLDGFPEKLLPVEPDHLGSAFMRFGTPGFTEQLQCAVRPVGTYGVAVADVGALELRSDMVTAAQGNEPDGRGFSPPSLLGLARSAPYFHNGGARTLEEVFDPVFAGHHEAWNALGPEEIALLVAFLASIDESTEPFPVPPRGPTGGPLCFSP
ncbi:MAG: hypothetical protein U0271_00875 [Polyangiaceae bacterium]